MCSLHLTHPSAHTHTPGAVGGSVSCSRVSPQSWTLPARAGIRTHNLGLPRVSSPTLYPLGHDCPDYFVLIFSIMFYHLVLQRPVLIQKDSHRHLALGLLFPAKTIEIQKRFAPILINGRKCAIWWNSPAS